MQRLKTSIEGLHCGDGALGNRQFCRLLGTDRGIVVDQLKSATRFAFVGTACVKSCTCAAFATYSLFCAGTGYFGLPPCSPPIERKLCPRGTILPKQLPKMDSPWYISRAPRRALRSLREARNPFQNGISNNPSEAEPSANLQKVVVSRTPPPTSLRFASLQHHFLCRHRYTRMVGYHHWAWAAASKFGVRRRLRRLCRRCAINSLSACDLLHV